MYITEILAEVKENGCLSEMADKLMMKMMREDITRNETDWYTFDFNLLTKVLKDKYSMDRERYEELWDFKSVFETLLNARVVEFYFDNDTEINMRMKYGVLENLLEKKKSRNKKKKEKEKNKHKKLEVIRKTAPINEDELPF